MGQAPLTLLKGTLDVLVLKALSWGALHGYAISRWIRETTHETLEVQEGVLYPALHRLERRGYVSSEWNLSESNRRVKSYELTARGRGRPYGLCPMLAQGIDSGEPERALRQFRERRRR